MLFDIPIMHTFVDDFVRWLNKTFLGRDYVWRAEEVEDDADNPSEEELVSAS